MRKALLEFRDGSHMAVPVFGFGEWPHTYTHRRPVLRAPLVVEESIEDQKIEHEMIVFQIDRARFNPESKQQYYVEDEA